MYFFAIVQRLKRTRKRKQSALLDENVLLSQIPVQFLAQTEQVFRVSGIIWSSSRCGRFSRWQLPGSLSDTEAKGVVSALVLHKVVRIVLTRMIAVHVVGEVVQIQKIVSVIAFSYTKPVISETLADAKWELPRSLRIKFLCERM